MDKGSFSATQLGKNNSGWMIHVTYAMQEVSASLAHFVPLIKVYNLE
jgi:hypothetical protein